MERGQHMFTSVSPMSLMGGSIDFSGDLQLTVNQILPGTRSKVPREVHVVLFPAWDFGLSLAALCIDLKVMRHTVVRGHIHVSTIFKTTIPVRAADDVARAGGGPDTAVVHIPEAAWCSTLEAPESSSRGTSTFCVQINTRVAGVPPYLMHRYPGVAFYT